VGSLDPLSQPLHAVTFCVVDLETTGGSPASSTITEVGAVNFRGGERLGTLQTLVNPGVPVAPEVTALTGITPAMLAPAPTIAEVLPSLAEFVGGAVLVGHNLRFDTSFLDAALAATGRSVLDHLRVDTVPLARRLLGDEVPDCKLGTLAAHLGLDHRPTHRALDDALATAELLHLLLERAAAFGVTLLDDLLTLPQLAGHPQAAKLRQTTRLPRSPGAYVVRNRRGEAVHAGHAPDVRRQVRSYFSATPSVAADDRRAAGRVPREAHAFDHLACASGLDAAVAAARLAHVLAPHLGIAGPPEAAGLAESAVATAAVDDAAVPGVAGAGGVGRPPWAAPIRPGNARFVALAGGAARRLVTGRTPRGTAGAASSSRSSSSARRAQAEVGPLPKGEARPFVEAVEAAVQIAAASGAERAEVIVAGFGGRPAALVDPLLAEAARLDGEGRHAAAVLARRQAEALATALERQRRLDGLRRSGRVVLGLPDGARVELVRGRLVRTWHADRSSTVWAGEPAGDDSGRVARATIGGIALDEVAPPPADGPLTDAAADELLTVAAWLDAHAGQVRLLRADGELASPLPRVPDAGRAGVVDVVDLVSVVDVVGGTDRHNDASNGGNGDEVGPRAPVEAAVAAT
jgi:DNA polymerase III subunit epsilon